MTPLRLRIIGCGAITQVQHLPNRLDLQEQFTVTVACDRSFQTAQYFADRFHIPQRVTDYRDLLACDIDAVLLCHTDPTTEVARAAFAADRHVFLETPVCFSLEEIDCILEAQRTAGKVGQAGYMKVYDPAFEMAHRHIVSMSHLRFAQVNHLHVNNSLHLAQFDLNALTTYPLTPKQPRPRPGSIPATKQ